MKSANESLGAQNAKLTAQVAELGRFLNLVTRQTSQTSQLVAQFQSQGQAVQGRVLGMETGIAQVMAQVGGLGREVQQQKASMPPVPPAVNVTLQVDPRCVAELGGGGQGHPSLASPHR